MQSDTRSITQYRYVLAQMITSMIGLFAAVTIVARLNSDATGEW